MLSFNVAKYNKNSQIPTAYFPDFRKANFEMINSELQSVDWLTLLNSGKSFQNLYSDFIRQINKTICKYVPKISNKKRANLKMPKYIKKLLKEKLTAYKKSKQDKSFKKIYKEKAKMYDDGVKSWHDKMDTAV